MDELSKFLIREGAANAPTLAPIHLRHMFQRIGFDFPDSLHPIQERDHPLQVVQRAGGLLPRIAPGRERIQGDLVGQLPPATIHQPQDAPDKQPRSTPLAPAPSASFQLRNVIVEMFPHWLLGRVAA